MQGAWAYGMNACMDVRNDYKEIAGVGSVILMTRVMGFEELQSEMSDRDPCSSFVMESAWPTWGTPLLPYLSLGVYPE